jgi:hypothetical protein
MIFDFIIKKITFKLSNPKHFIKMIFSQQSISRADPNEIIESTVYSWWQKYVIGVNMSYIDCDHRLPNCTFPRYDNTLYVMTHYENVSLKISFSINIKVMN